MKKDESIIITQQPFSKDMAVDGLVKVLDGTLRLTHFRIYDASISVGVDKLRVEADNFVVVLNGMLRLPPISR